MRALAHGEIDIFRCRPPASMPLQKAMHFFSQFSGRSPRSPQFARRLLCAKRLTETEFSQKQLFRF